MNTESKLREALREITNDYADRFDLDDPSTNPGIKAVITQAREALAQPSPPEQVERAQQAAAVPAGWKLVPIEPTPEMVDAGNKARLYREHGSLELSDVLSARTYNTKQSYTPTTDHSPGNMAQPIHDPAVTTPREVLVGESPVDRIAAPAQEQPKSDAQIILDIITLFERRPEFKAAFREEWLRYTGVEQQQAGAVVSEPSIAEFIERIKPAWHVHLGVLGQSRSQAEETISEIVQSALSQPKAHPHD